MSEGSNGVYRRAVRAWCMYDWANSAYATTVMAAMLPPYFSEIAQGAGFTETQATSMWGYITALTTLVIALAGPVLGAIADQTGSKKRFLFGFFAVAVLFTSSLVLVGNGDWLLALILFGLAAIGNAGANVFYDSLLPHVAKPEEIDQVSTRGYALGYLGGGLLLIVNLLMFMKPEWLGIPDSTWGVRLSFLTVGIWWVVFAIPLFRHVKEPPRAAGVGETVNPIQASFLQLAQTFRDIRRYKELALFLLAFWLYVDGIGTIMKMATIYGSEIGIGTTHLIGALLMTQFVGIPFTLLFGRLARRIGTKRSIFISLAVYTLISVGGYFMQEAWQFWVLAFMVGIVQGGSQALSRSLFGAMAPKAQSAEFFGFYDISSKFAGILGPAVFALVGQLTGTSRLGIVSLVVFFVGGGLLLWRVDEQEGIRVAQEANEAVACAT